MSAKNRPRRAGDRTAPRTWTGIDEHEHHTDGAEPNVSTVPNLGGRAACTREGVYIEGISYLEVGAVGFSSAKTTLIVVHVCEELSDYTHTAVLRLLSSRVPHLFSRGSSPVEQRRQDLVLPSAPSSCSGLRGGFQGSVAPLASGILQVKAERRKASPRVGLGKRSGAKSELEGRRKMRMERG